MDREPQGSPKRCLGYERVSTQQQADSGAGLDVQRRAIEDACTHRGWELLGIMSDPALTGKNMERPELARALEALSNREADALVALKVDRLSRSVADFANLLARAGREGWDLVILELGLDTSTPHGRFAAHMMAAVAELERELISGRTKDALAAKRAAGVRLGRPPSIPDDVRRQIRKMYRGGKRNGGMSARAVADRLNQRGVPTYGGGAKWHEATIRAVCSR